MLLVPWYYADIKEGGNSDCGLGSQSKSPYIRSSSSKTDFLVESQKEVLLQPRLTMEYL